MSVVMKFGGTSVSTTEKISQIANYIKQVKNEEENIVIVVSAMGKSTDHLISLAKQVSEKLDKREIDTLLATGEQQTIALLAIALKAQGVDAISLTGFQAGFRTTSSHTKGIIKDVDVTRVLSHLKQGQVVVVAGFQGMSDKGDITTLGRGGSDTSAVALAAKLGYKCEIYTDVDGIYTVDPRVYKDAKHLSNLSYDELMEMASKGAGVIETRSVELASKYNVPLYIARSLSKKGSGTYIMKNNYLFEEKPITGISITDEVVMVTLKSTITSIKEIKNVFNSISRHNINLDMISQNIEQENLVVSFSIDLDDLETLEECMAENSETFNHFNVSTTKDLVKLGIVGVGMASNFGVAAKVFDILANRNIPFYTVSTSEISISCTIDKENKSSAVEGLALGFEL